MKRRTKIVAVAAAALSLLLVATVLATSLLIADPAGPSTVSNVVQGQTLVDPAGDITLAVETMPNETSVGQRNVVWLDYSNPDTSAINGYIMVNFSAPGIGPNDVYLGVYDALFPINEGVYNNNTLVYELGENSVNGFLPWQFNPGTWYNATAFTLQYNIATTYNWTVQAIN